jgi:hypothetical protein
VAVEFGRAVAPDTFPIAFARPELALRPGPPIHALAPSVNKLRILGARVAVSCGGSVAGLADWIAGAFVDNTVKPCPAFVAPTGPLLITIRVENARSALDLARTNAVLAGIRARLLIERLTLCAGPVQVAHAATFIIFGRVFDAGKAVLLGGAKTPVAGVRAFTSVDLAIWAGPFLLTHAKPLNEVTVLYAVCAFHA